MSRALCRYPVFGDVWISSADMGRSNESHILVGVVGLQPSLRLHINCLLIWFVFFLNVHHECVRDIFGRVEDVVEQSLHLLDRPLCTSFVHPEVVE